MKLHKTAIPGCYEIECVPHLDVRGSFVKTFRASVFQNLSLESNFLETFHSTSSEKVLRGMHFQCPPFDGAKLVYCLQGDVLDVALDLRKGSPGFGRSVSFRLSHNRASAAYIPRGVAHGFFVSNGPATLVYNVSAEYESSADTGILWNSFGFEWPCTSPILSPRDHSFSKFSDFDSPFIYSSDEFNS